jgi:adenylate cyclase
LADRIRNITLKAILFADLADYSRLVSKREAETLAFIDTCFGIFRERCGEFDGIVVKTTGDGILAEFAAVSSAVHCAVAMHQAVDALQADQAQKA